MTLLLKHASININQGPLVLIILDGVGLGKKGQNAIHLQTLLLELTRDLTLYTQLKAHGTAIGYHPMTI